MARHNRDSRGTDQRGFDCDISYQPDWVRLIKVTRSLESGRQSTKTLFKNPARPEQTLFGRGECYGLTRSVGFVRGVAHDGDAEDPVAHVTGTFIVTA